MNQSTKTVIKVILGLIIIWGGFKLQSYLWPIDNADNFGNIKSTNIE